MTNLVIELELEKIDLMGKINALDNRLEFHEISTKQYNLLAKKLKMQLNRKNFVTNATKG